MPCWKRFRIRFGIRLLAICLWAIQAQAFTPDKSWKVIQENIYGGLWKHKGVKIVYLKTSHERVTTVSAKNIDAFISERRGALENLGFRAYRIDEKKIEKINNRDVLILAGVFDFNGTRFHFREFSYYVGKTFHQVTLSLEKGREVPPWFNPRQHLK